MIEIIPAINVDSFEEIQNKIKQVEPFAKWVQIDVADGTFTKNIIWHNPQDLLSLETNLNIEVHLMINDIDRRVNDWFIPQVDRIIFHLSTSENPDFVIQKCREAGKEVGIAISPDESWTKAVHFKNKVNLFQILGVHPGLPGQEIQEESFNRIGEVKKFCSSCIIEVDGGMNKETVRRAVEAGADTIVAASAIFKNNEIEENIKDLKNYKN